MEWAGRTIRLGSPSVSNCSGREYSNRSRLAGSHASAEAERNRNRGGGNRPQLQGSDACDGNDSQGCHYRRCSWQAARPGVCRPRGRGWRCDFRICRRRRSGGDRCAQLGHSSDNRSEVRRAQTAPPQHGAGCDNSHCLRDRVLLSAYARGYAIRGTGADPFRRRRRWAGGCAIGIEGREPSSLRRLAHRRSERFCPRLGCRT